MTNPLDLRAEFVAGYSPTTPETDRMLAEIARLRVLAGIDAGLISAPRSAAERLNRDYSDMGELQSTLKDLISILRDKLQIEIETNAHSKEAT